MKCVHCSEEGVHDLNGRGTMYCPMHYRLRVMRMNAKANGKYAPTMVEMRALVPDLLVCPVCKLEMFWAADDLRASVSLQHWQDGTLSLVCHSCNSRMRTRDEIPPEGHHWCRLCERNLPNENFVTRMVRDTRQFQSHCKACNAKYMRDYHAARRLAGS